MRNAFIRLIRFVIRHPVDQLSEPMRSDLAVVRWEITAARDELLATIRNDLAPAVEKLQIEAREIRAELDRLAEAGEKNRAELAAQGGRLERILRALDGAETDAVGESSRAILAQELERLLGEQYDDFERVFRGSPEAIRERLSPYLADVLDVEGGPVLDIGSGRGEWLDLLKEEGRAATGVELSEVFAEDSRRRGHEVTVGDGVAALRGRPEGSLGAVTAFHVVEHLEFAALIELVDAALAALQPGGILILETPNPTNLAVGSASFHLDPTHVRPVHPQLLEYVVRARGFVHVELRFLDRRSGLGLQLPEQTDRALVEQLNRELFGAEDYAVVARKPVSAAAA
jgi:SAM-dependent methyltransferase